MKSENEFKEIKVLLSYFVKHNVSHSEELAELLERMKPSVSEDVIKLIEEALVSYNDGNAKLEKAFSLLEDK